MTARPSFRLAVPAERRALEDLQRRASLVWEEDRDALLANPDAIELPLEQITDGRTIVAENVGQLLGFAVVLRRDDGDAELDGLFVDPTQWRHGIGRALLEHAERSPRDGAATLWVTANTRALGFYGACGFLTVGEVATRFRPAPRMRKTIDVARCDVRVALIGYGLGGAAFHAPLIACTPGMRLATIVTRNPERRAQAAREHPQGEHRRFRASDMGSVAQDHDVVVVTTSNDAHASLAMDALAAGLPVVVDKPFAVHASQAREVIAEARRRNLLLTVYHNRRWDSELLTVKRLLAEQAFGDVLRFESRLERWRPQPKGGWRERGEPELAGGLLYDLGTHLIDQALHLFGPVTDVYAELDRRRPGMQVDDDVFLALTHASGVRSHLSATTLSAQPLARMRVLGLALGIS